MTTRREVLAGALTLGLVAPVAAAPRVSAASDLGPRTLTAWSALDLGSGRRIGQAQDRRMPMCSSFKWLVAACVLARVDRRLERLNRPVTFGHADMLEAAPVTSATLAAAGGIRATMSVAELAAAATAVSDNGAANLLLRAVGGPTALIAWLRRTGDAVTRCDRFEPDNNHVPLGDPRDTTTPDAAIGDLRRYLYGDVLTPGSRAQLMSWMLGCQVGAQRLKAGLPTGWRIAHRTGTRDNEPEDRVTGRRSAMVDMGALIPPAGPPILIAAYAAGWTVPLESVEPWFARIARHAVLILRGSPTAA